MVYGVVDLSGKRISPGVSLEGDFSLSLSLSLSLAHVYVVGREGYLLVGIYATQNSAVGIRRLHF